MNIITASEQIGFPIISLTAFLPLLAGLYILFFVDAKKVEFIRKFAFGVTIVDFILSLGFITNFKYGVADIQFVEHANWIPSIGADYLMGVDGISVVLVLLTTFLAPLTILSTWKAIDFRVKEFMVNMLVLQTSVLGLFCAMDMLLLYIFLEVMLVPMYFIVAIWGGGRRLYSAVKFFLYTLIGSFLVLLAFLAIYFYNSRVTGVYTFSWLEWSKLVLPMGMQKWLFWAFFIGFAVKVPVFPFHTWLPDAHVDAPTAGSVVLAGVLLKVGTYALVRLPLPLVPEACHQYGSIAVGLAFMGIVYTALVAFVQKDVKKLVAYSSVAHLGFVILGMFVLNFEGLDGSVLQMLNHGLSTSALFLLVGLIYERRHTRMISEFGGLFKVMPIFAAVFAVTVFSSVGIPGLNGFIGEVYILAGAYKANSMYALLCGLGILLGYTYTFWMFQRVILMDVKHEENRKLPDMSKRELWTLLPIVIMYFWIGLNPAPTLNVIGPSVRNLASMLEQRKPVVHSIGEIADENRMVQDKNVQEVSIERKAERDA